MNMTSDNETGAAKMYSMASAVADEASRNGFRELARALEATLSGFLSGLTRDEQRQALQLSYELATAGAGVEPAPPRIRLAYSRD
jgi:hypothetical protein